MRNTDNRKKVEGVSQLTGYERSRFAQNRICTTCGGVIFDDDKIYMMKRRIGHRTFYFFDHADLSRCVEEARKHG